MRTVYFEGIRTLIEVPTFAPVFANWLSYCLKMFAGVRYAPTAFAGCCIFRCSSDYIITLFLTGALRFRSLDRTPLRDSR